MLDQLMTARVALLRNGASIGVLALALLAASCGGGGNDTSGDELVVGGAEETVTIEGFKFSPGNLQVPAGATITFINEDSATHDAVADNDTWETERLGDGESDTVTLEEPGEYRYVCTLHRSMKARITVVAPN